LGGAAAAAAVVGGLFYALVLRPRAHRGRVRGSMRAPSPSPSPSPGGTIKNPLAAARGARIARVAARGAAAMVASPAAATAAAPRTQLATEAPPLTEAQAAKRLRAAFEVMPTGACSFGDAAAQETSWVKVPGSA
jgi:hypothetical protein